MEKRAEMMTSKTGDYDLESRELLFQGQQRRPRPIFSVLDYIQDVPVFSGLSSEQLVMIHSGCKETFYRKGSVILQQDEPGCDLYVILSGEVRVSLISENGAEILLSNLKTGQFFGELSLLDNKRRSAMVTASSDVKILLLARNAFL